MAHHRHRHTDKHTWYRVAPQLKINLAKLDWCLNKTENAITKRGILNLDVHQDQRILYTLCSKYNWWTLVLEYLDVGEILGANQ